MAKKGKYRFFMVQVEEKNAIARVRLVEGNGKITINGKDIDEFFGLETFKSYCKTTTYSYKYNS